MAAKYLCQEEEEDIQGSDPSTSRYEQELGAPEQPASPNAAYGHREEAPSPAIGLDTFQPLINHILIPMRNFTNVPILPVEDVFYSDMVWVPCKAIPLHSENLDSDFEFSFHYANRNVPCSPVATSSVSEHPHLASETRSHFSPNPSQNEFTLPIFSSSQSGLPFPYMSKNRNISGTFNNISNNTEEENKAPEKSSKKLGPLETAKVSKDDSKSNSKPFKVVEDNAASGVIPLREGENKFGQKPKVSEPDSQKSVGNSLEPDISKNILTFLSKLRASISKDKDERHAGWNNIISSELALFEKVFTQDSSDKLSLRAWMDSKNKVHRVIVEILRDFRSTISRLIEITETTDRKMVEEAIDINEVLSLFDGVEECNEGTEVHLQYDSIDNLLLLLTIENPEEIKMLEDLTHVASIVDIELVKANIDISSAFGIYSEQCMNLPWDLFTVSQKFPNVFKRSVDEAINSDLSTSSPRFDGSEIGKKKLNSNKKTGKEHVAEASCGTDLPTSSARFHGSKIGKKKLKSNKKTGKENVAEASCDTDLPTSFARFDGSKIGKKKLNSNKKTGKEHVAEASCDTDLPTSSARLDGSKIGKKKLNSNKKTGNENVAEASCDTDLPTSSARFHGSKIGKKKLNSNKKTGKENVAEASCDTDLPTSSATFGGSEIGKKKLNSDKKTVKENVAEAFCDTDLPTSSATFDGSEIGKKKLNSNKKTGKENVAEASCDTDLPTSSARFDGSEIGKKKLNSNKKTGKENSSPDEREIHFRNSIMDNISGYTEILYRMKLEVLMIQQSLDSLSAFYPEDSNMKAMMKLFKSLRALSEVIGNIYVEVLERIKDKESSSKN